MTNVVSIRTGLPLDVEQQMIEEVALDEQIRRETEMADDAEEMKTRLKVAQGLIEHGRLTGMMLVGVDPVTGLFFTDINVKSMPREELFAYMGVLQTVIMEIQEHASMAPTIGAECEILDPYLEPAL